MRKLFVVLVLVAAMAAFCASAMAQSGGTVANVGPVWGSVFNVHGFINLSGSGDVNDYMPKDIWVRSIGTTAADSLHVSLWRLSGSTYSRVAAPAETSTDTFVVCYGGDWVHITLQKGISALWVDSPTASGAQVMWR